MKVGFSKFAILHPKNCILAEASGTHYVCICTTHQNVKLMLEGLKLLQLTTNSDTRLCSYHPCLAIMICHPPTQKCFFNEYKECPGQSKVKEILKNISEESAIETVTCKQWLSTDRATLQTIIKSNEDFQSTSTVALLYHFSWEERA
jgi:hypothetical protein